MKDGNSSRIYFKQRKGDTQELAAQLAPLEEQDKPAAEQQIGSPGDATSASPADRNFGAIVVDSEHLKVANDLAETQENKQLLGMEPVVLIVLILMLGFIGFITWQISLMPAR